MSADSPSIARSMKRGVGMNDGRCSALPKAVAKSRLVTGFGAVALSGPTASVVVESQSAYADHIFDVNPTHPLLAVADGAAHAQAKRRPELL